MIRIRGNQVMMTKEEYIDMHQRTSAGLFIEELHAVAQDKVVTRHPVALVFKGEKISLKVGRKVMASGKSIKELREKINKKSVPSVKSVAEQGVEL